MGPDHTAPHRTIRWAAILLASVTLGLAPLAAHAGGSNKILASGSMKGASGHATTGNVAVVETENGLVVVLASNFNFDGAPDPKVGFGTSGSYDRAAQLGHLESNSGEQRYKVPASVDPSEYNEIYIWCQKYAVPLGVAKIK